MKADTFNCDADLYWRIIAKGKETVPFLIEKLTDTTPTNIKFHCKSTKLNVGEVADFVLKEIAEFPAFLVTKIQFDIIVQGCWSFYDFLFINENKVYYQKCMRDWYNKKNRKYKARRISEEYATDCHKQFKIATYYKLTGKYWKN